MAARTLAAVQLEALASDGQRLTAWPSSSSTREAKRLTHGRLRGAYLQLPAPEATALVLVEGSVDALAARWLHPGAVVQAVLIGERGRGDVAEALAAAWRSFTQTGDRP